MYSYGPPHMAVQKQDDQHEHTFSSYVRIRDVVLKTYLGRWTIGRSGERGSGISVLPARYDDDRSLPYRWAAIVPRSNWRSWPLSREIHTSRIRLGIALGRQRVYSHTFTSFMLLPMSWKKKILSFPVSFNFVKVQH